MRKILVNIMATTGLSLLLLALVAALFGGSWIAIGSILQTFAANIAIHAGLAFLRRFECESAVLETLRNLSYVVIVILGFGAVFGWFSSTPVWAIVPMCAAVYGLGLLLSVFRIREEAAEINSLLKLRDRQAKE